MIARPTKMVIVSVLAAGMGLVALGARPRPGSTDFGDPLRGLQADELSAFADGKDEFEQVETASDGLGPVFTSNSCGACHSSPAIGGGSELVETRIGATVSGRFDPLTAVGGPLIQNQGIGRGTGVNGPYNYVGEIVPPEAQLVAGRRTTPLFGLGLVEAVPDDTLVQLARSQRSESPGTAGTPHMVTTVATSVSAVGRFGWKSQRATLLDFAGDAYVNEMGITTPLFPSEIPPQGNTAALNFNPLPLGVPNKPDNEDLEAFANFMRLLAPPPRGPAPRLAAPAQQGRSGRGRRRGQPAPQPPDGAQIFAHIGCAACHVPTLETGDSEIAALDHKVFHPFSDFLLHDMGSLGDGMEQGQANGRQMRTAPLWGLHAQMILLHDGRAKSVSAAILAHEGQGAASRDQFVQLSDDAKAALLAFLNSL